MNMQHLRRKDYGSSGSRLGWATAALTFLIVICVASQLTFARRVILQESSKAKAVEASDQQEAKFNQETDPNQQEADGKVIGIKNVCVHVMKLEKTLKLYREILGFKMANASVLHGKGIEGMLVMELKAGDCKVHLSLPAPGGFGLQPIGNTNHNHFMLVVDNIVPICDKLKQEGYELENDNYARDKYSFFTGPNGEIVGLTEYK